MRFPTVSHCAPAPARPRPAPATLAAAVRGAFRAATVGRIETVAAATALAVLPALGQPAVATADTARIVPDDGPPAFRGPARASIVITSADGRVRTLGPYRFSAEPTELTSSPDGSHLAVGFGLADQSHEIAIVPTDGSGPFALRITPRSLVTTSTSGFSWSADGSELVVGGADDQRAPRGRWRFRAAALRCPVATRSCTRIPGSEGLAAAIPGGIVTSTRLDDVLPSGSQFNSYVPPTTIDTDPSRQSRYERELLREVRTPERTRTTLVRTGEGPPRTTVLVSRRSRLSRGTDAAIDLFGGPSGALIVHDRQRVVVTQRGRTLRLRSRSQGGRWTVVAPDGTRRTRPIRLLLVPKADAPTRDWGRELPRQRVGAVPSVSVTTGGWLGTVGFVRGAGPGGYVLARITPSGASTFLRAGGRLASARNLVRSTVGRAPTPGSASLDVVGYETSTDTAIVTLDWLEGPDEPGTTTDLDGTVESADDGGPRRATVRVPLDGRTAPTLVNHELEHAAW